MVLVILESTQILKFSLDVIDVFSHHIMYTEAKYFNTSING
jgi:hypothetical protein